jgi:hypothetical protein
MKLIVAGASGFVATEIIRQSLSLPQITSVIALARRTVSPPDNLDSGADASKLHSAVLKDYDEYPEDVKKQFGDADACIWYFYSWSENAFSFLHLLISAWQDCCRHTNQITRSEVRRRSPDLP